MKSIFCAGLFIYMLMLIGCTPIEKTTKSDQINDEKVVLGYINPNTFQLYDIATEVKYGYTSEFSIKVGGRVEGDHVLNERRYLNALTGPKGETVVYKQLGSCCYVKKNIRGENQLTYLDKFEIFYKGNPQRFIIFINTFEAAKMFAPKGFSFKVKAKKNS